MINISEGRNLVLLDELSGAAGVSLRDRHHDPVHHRSVFTLINEPDQLEADVASLVGCAFELLSLEDHRGVHPRFGVVDVVPFVALDPRERTLARELRDTSARWISETFAVPTFLYGDIGDGTTRSLPDLRRDAFFSLAPDFGPNEPSPVLGAVAVGERPVLVAWNIWLGDTSIARARELAAHVRSTSVRALGFDLGEFVQVSCNLLDVAATPPSALYDQVVALLRSSEHVARCELVGLIPDRLLELVEPARWVQLGLSRERTIEAVLEKGSAGL